MGAIGRMRERIKVYEVVQGQGDNLGGFQTERTLVKTVWARIEQEDGSRELESQRVKNTNSYTITVRAGSYNITTENLLEHDGIEYVITSVTRDQEKRFSIIQAYSNG